MTDRPPSPIPPVPPIPPDPGRGRTSDRDNRWEERARWREQRRSHAQGGAWFGGLLLIAIGVIFLLRNSGVTMPDNWWAVFILIPAFGSFSAAWSMYRNSGGEVTAGVVGAAGGGILLALLALAFFLDLPIGKYWPVILIVLGIVAIATNTRRR